MGQDVTIGLQKTGAREPVGCQRSNSSSPRFCITFSQAHRGYEKLYFVDPSLFDHSFIVSRKGLISISIYISALCKICQLYKLRKKGNFSRFEALWPSAYMSCHDHCQSCHWRETDIFSQIQMKNQRLEFGEIPRINCTEKTSLKCPSKSSFDSDLTTLCSRQIEPSGIITANFHTIKPPTHFIPQICFCEISLESLLCFMGK